MRHTRSKVLLAPVVERVDSTIHWINPYPLDNAINFDSTYPRLTLGNIGWIRSRTERRSCFPMSLTSSSSSRDRNKYVGIWSRCKQREVLVDINRIAIAGRASLEEFDRPYPYSAIFFSITRGRRWRQRHRKTRFSLGSTSPYVI